MAGYTQSILDAFEGLEIGSVLDVGCGNATHLLELRDKFPDAYLRGCDTAENEIENATNAVIGKDIFIDNVDMYDLPYKNPFDVILLAAVLILVPPEKIVDLAESIKKIAKKHIIIMDRHDEGQTIFGEIEGSGRTLRAKRNYKKLFNLPVSYESPVSPWNGFVLRFDL